MEADRTHPGSPTALALGLLAVAAAGCAGPIDEEAPPPKQDWLATVRGAEITLARSPELDDIARLEDARSTGGGRLVAYLQHADERVRRRAVVALGRLPFPEIGREVTEPLCKALEDPAVRTAAAFALGQRGDPVSGGVLLAYMNDPEAEMRARVVEAASKLPGNELHGDLVRALRDADLNVRIEAVLGTARWAPDELRDPDIDRALIDTLRPYTIAPDRTSRSAVEAELVWRILFALQRRGSELGRGAFLEYSTSDVPLERLFAVKGLGKLSSEPRVVAAAAAILTGEDAAEDWRVAYEATVALRALADPAGLDALIEATGFENNHVYAGALRALGAFPDHQDRTLSHLRRGLRDISGPVRIAALISLAEVLEPHEAVDAVERVLDSEDPVVRAGAAQAIALVDSPRTVEILRQLAADRNALVATRAVEGLGRRGGADARVLLHELLKSPDNGIRLAAVLALREDPDDTDAPYLIEAARTSTGDIATEIAFNVVESLGKTPGAPGATDFVRAALVDPRPIVRDVAARVLAEDLGMELGARPVLPRPEPTAIPLPGEGYPAWTENPLVELATSRGKMVFELFPAEAPLHVVNFLELAQAGEYDGTTFHRVVPDFVIQGGDYRGDGNGARPSRGEALRHELGERRYVRGSLGMPRNQDVDSGGSQIFVTHRPTPHLDGRYTIFGELRTGGTVLDAVQQGDRILGVRILP
jgi:cyclophilin family peptidyl-prolyl cis-trans isomerase/HEAT repeat protein